MTENLIQSAYNDILQRLSPTPTLLFGYRLDLNNPIHLVVAAYFLGMKDQLKEVTEKKYDNHS